MSGLDLMKTIKMYTLYKNDHSMVSYADKRFSLHFGIGKTLFYLFFHSFHLNFRNLICNISFYLSAA